MIRSILDHLSGWRTRGPLPEQERLSRQCSDYDGEENDALRLRRAWRGR